MSPGISTIRLRAIDDTKSDGNVIPIQVSKNKAVLAEEIRLGWKESLEGIVQTGLSLIEGRYKKAEYEHYRLPFSYSWGKRLIKIASSKRIVDPTNRVVLPDKADALHQIVLLTDKLFNLAVSEGVVNRHCLVIDIQTFRRSFAEHGRCRRRKMTIVYECDPHPGDNAVEVLDAFVSAVQKLAQTRFPAISVRRPRKIAELAHAG